MNPAREEAVSVRDRRTEPFYKIERALLEVIRPSWKGLVAYNALAYYAINWKIIKVGIRQMAARVGVSEDTMKRGLAELLAKKAIQVRTRVKIKAGKRMALPNEYILIDLRPESKRSI